MIKVTPFTKNTLRKYSKFREGLKALPKEGLKEFKSLTPKRSGYARNHTKLEGSTIIADYKYAKRLDEGHSNQAPKGMVEPFTKWLSKKFKQIFSGIG